MNFFQQWGQFMMAGAKAFAAWEIDNAHTILHDRKRILLLGLLLIPVLLGGMALSILAFGCALTLGAGDTAAFAVICVASGAALGADLTLLPALFVTQCKSPQHSASSSQPCPQTLHGVAGSSQIPSALQRKPSQQSALTTHSSPPPSRARPQGLAAQ